MRSELVFVGSGIEIGEHLPSAHSFRGAYFAMLQAEHINQRGFGDEFSNGDA